MTAPPPDKDDLLDVFRRVTPANYHDPIAADPSYALFRGMSATLAATARKALRSVQARYYLPSSLQVDEPASSAAKAAGFVTLRRGDTLPRDEAFLAEPGQFRIEAIGRVYVNVDRILWEPGDFGSRVIAFECEIPGFVGNLDHLADADGNLPADVPELADQSRDRAGASGSIVIETSSIARDAGSDDLFAPEDVGLYLRVNNSAVLSNVGQLRRALGFRWLEQELPPGTGRYPRDLLLDDTTRRNATEVQIDNGGVFTDAWGAASNETTGDFALLPTPLTVNDALYFGHTVPFTGIDVVVETPGEGTWSVSWEYWNGASWAVIPNVDDAAQGWRPLDAGYVSVRFAAPAGWAARTSPAGTGLNLYFVRARLSAHTTTTTAPVGSRAVLLVPEPLAADAGAVTWALLDGSDLGVEIVSAQAFGGGRDNDLFILGDERGVYQQDGESDDAFRVRASRLADRVAPNAIRRVVNRSLQGTGYRGDAIDVGNDLLGFFLDTDALDYYEPGDAFPTSPWRLLLDYDEAHGFGLVILPYLGQGEFGFSYDEGPIILGGDPAGDAGPAWDSGFLDGYPVTALGVYGAVWAAVDRARAAGVGFDLVRDDSLNVLGC